MALDCIMIPRQLHCYAAISLATEETTLKGLKPVWNLRGVPLCFIIYGLTWMLNINLKHRETHGCIVSIVGSGYWCPGANAPGHQYPQCWLNIHCIGPVSYKTIAHKVNRTASENEITFWKKWPICLTHWGRVTHICVIKFTIIGSDNGLSPSRRQAIIWTNAGILLIRPSGTNFSETLIENNVFLFKKMHLKMSSGKCRPFYLGLNVLRVNHAAFMICQLEYTN